MEAMLCMWDLCVCVFLSQALPILPKLALKLLSSRDPPALAFLVTHITVPSFGSHFKSIFISFKWFLWWSAQGSLIG